MKQRAFFNMKKQLSVREQEELAELQLAFPPTLTERQLKRKARLESKV